MLQYLVVHLGQRLSILRFLLELAESLSFLSEVLVLVLVVLKLILEASQLLQLLIDLLLALVEVVALRRTLFHLGDGALDLLDVRRELVEQLSELRHVVIVLELSDLDLTVQALLGVVACEQVCQVASLLVDLCVSGLEALTKGTALVLEVIESHKAAINLSWLELGGCLRHLVDLTLGVLLSLLLVLNLGVQVFEQIFILTRFNLHLCEPIEQLQILLSLISLGFVDKLAKVLEFLLLGVVSVSALG